MRKHCFILWCLFHDIANQRLEQLVMNTFHLAQVLTKDLFVKGSFCGVYASDELTSIEINTYPKSLVINSDPMEFPGTHWIAIYTVMNR